MIRAFIILAVIIAIGVGISVQRSNNPKASKPVIANEPVKPSAKVDVVWETDWTRGNVMTLPSGERIFIYTIWYQGRGLATTSVLLPPLTPPAVEK